MSKEEKRLYTKFIILIICLIIMLRIFGIVLAKYESEAMSNANVEIAFYLLNEDYKKMTLNLGKLLPKDDVYVYTFSIGNQKDNQQADVDLIYDLTIKTTTNLPLRYELYKNQDYNSKNATSIKKTDEIIKDEEGTYFRIITTEGETLKYNKPTTNIYQLVVNFPENYNTEEYQDIIEAIEIVVQGKQII